MKKNTPYIIAITWLLLAALGFVKLTTYQSAVRESSKITSNYPSNSELTAKSGLSTLIVFIHPHCPCSRASIDSLAWIMTRSQGKVTAYVAFLKPDKFPSGWEKTDMWRSAKAIPGVLVYQDRNGSEAKLFHTTVSGETLLYGADGKLQFHGGITESRGHFGDNVGRSAIVSILAGKSKGGNQTFVYGCSLFNSEDTPGKSI